jgi:hypothetical protein
VLGSGATLSTSDIDCDLDWPLDKEEPLSNEALQEWLQRCLDIEQLLSLQYLHMLYTVPRPELVKSPLRPAATYASKALRRLAISEMIHMGQVANIMVRLGGEPDFFSAMRFHKDDEASFALKPFGLDALNRAIAYEQSAFKLPPRVELSTYTEKLRLEKVGLSYRRVWRDLCLRAKTLDRPIPERSKTSFHTTLTPGLGDTPIDENPMKAVNDILGRLRAIMSEGEGFDLPSKKGSSHVEELQKLLDVEGLLAGSSSFEDIKKDSGEFFLFWNELDKSISLTYQSILVLLQNLWRTKTEANEAHKVRQMQKAQGYMSAVMATLCEVLAQVPRFRSTPDRYCGPTFSFVEPAHSGDIDVAIKNVTESVCHLLAIEPPPGSQLQFEIRPRLASTLETLKYFEKPLL